MAKALKFVKFVFSREEGATMLEYAIMISLIAAICVGVVAKFGKNLEKEYKEIVRALK
jgi:Flp pilus assembly pilin Flp